MLENEEVQTQEGVEAEVSPTPQESTQSEEISTKPAAETAGAEQTEERNLPFDKHPRFRELIEQKNEAIARQKQLEEGYRQLNARLDQFQKAQTPRDKPKDVLLERLKGIDPEFAERIESLQNRASEIEELKTQLKEYEAAQVRNQAISTVNNLHEQHKVPEELRSLYNSQIELAVIQNHNLRMEDLPNLYKTIHESVSKVFENAKREATGKYVQEKKQDALPSMPAKSKAPAQTKGDFKYSSDPAEARSQVVKRILSQAKAENSL